MLPPLHAVRLPPAGGGLCNSAFHLIVALCSLFVAELFTVLLTYILKSQPFQDGRTMCRSVPVSMRGWCRSPLRAARQGGGGGGGEAGAGRHGGAAPGGDQGSAVRQLRATASHCSHRSALSWYWPGEAAEAAATGYDPLEAGLAVTRLVTAGPTAATSPASPNLQCQPSHCTIHHNTTPLGSIIVIYLQYISKYLYMANSMGGLYFLRN